MRRDRSAVRHVGLALVATLTLMACDDDDGGPGPAQDPGPQEQPGPQEDPGPQGEPGPQDEVGPQDDPGP